MELYNLARWSIYSDHPTEKQTNMKHNKYNIIITWDPYYLLEIYNIAHGGTYIHIHMYIYQTSPKHVPKTYTKDIYQNIRSTNE